MNDLTQTFEGVLEQLPQIVLAFIVLILGFIIAAIVGRGVRKALEKMKLSDRILGEKNTDAPRSLKLETIIGKIVYWLIVIAAFVWFLNMLNIDMLAEPLSNMLSSVTGAIPALIKAGIILLVAYVIAIVLKKLIEGAGGKISGVLVKAKVADDETSAQKSVHTLAQIVFYLVLLFAVPAVLSALSIQNLSASFSSMIESILTFIPKLVAAAITLLIGWLVAKIVRDILTKFLQSIGTDRVADKLKLSSALKGTSLSHVIGTIAFILILIPAVISALETLALEGISQPAIGMLNEVLAMLPQIAVAALLIIVGIVLGGWLKGMVMNLLQRLGVNGLMRKMGLGQAEERSDVPSLAAIGGYVAQVFVIFLFTIEALQVINLEFLVDLATGVVAYLPSVFAAIVILGVGLWLADTARRFVASAVRTPGGNSNVLASIAKYAILAFALFMALDQLGVADSIINTAFMLILGALALAFGLAFGLGGREKAAEYLEKADKKMETMNVETSSDNQDPSDKE
ncbi:mechanosensitive ion channel [Halobacillus salinus]|uniref:mechanosensitive ion channel n=1 Tax=Halobacillus salinus TaxID=192814 RepID=UPI0009A58446|nr:mechanosensitive ion channel [Halobacillus salinus]